VLGALDDVRRIREAGGDIEFVEDQISTRGPTGQLLLTVMFAFAEWERENMVAGFAEAKRRAVERGAYVSKMPYGFEREEDGTLAARPEQAEHVATAYRLAASRGVHAALAILERDKASRQDARAGPH
jgi:DNA invertase Pin-like site-specific DNA recombinase